MQQESNDNNNNDDLTVSTNRSGTWDDSSQSVRGTNGFTCGFIGVQDKPQETNEYKNSICLDSGSSLDLFCNRDLVYNCKDTKSTLLLETNAGTSTSNKEANIPGRVNPVRFDERGITNIFSLYLLSKEHRITMDTKKENAILVHHPNGHVSKFIPRNGIYVFEPNENYRKLVKELEGVKTSGVQHLVTTVTENKKAFTAKQFERAKMARRIYHMMGAPTIAHLAKLIQTNMIRNNPLTMEDVKLAQAIFGEDVATLKGKSTRKQTPTRRTDYIDIPKEIQAKYGNIELCMDTMEFNKVYFLTFIDTTIRYRKVVGVANKKSNSYYEAIDMTLRLYNSAGFTITKITCDNEYRSLVNSIKDDLNVDVEYVNAQEHESVAERNVRTIKERMRTIYHSLPYKYLPKLILEYMCYEAATKLNIFPAKHGVSAHYSPYVIMHRKPLDYNVHFQARFGEYVLADHEANPKNTLAPRKLDTIYLSPNYKSNGGHFLYHIQTDKVITRGGRLHIAEMTKNIVDLIDKRGERQGFKQHKIFDKKKKPLDADDDTAWIAGAEFEEYEEINESLGINDDEDQENEQDDDEIDEENNEEQVREVLESEQYESNQSNPTSENEEVEQDPDEVIANQDEEIVFDAEDDESEESEESSEEEDEDDEEGKVEEETGRPTRTRRQATRMNIGDTKGKSYLGVSFKDEVDRDKQQVERCHNIITQSKKSEIIYEDYEAMILCHIMQMISESVEGQETSLAQQYVLEKGLKIFKEKGEKSVHKEMKQLDDRTCYLPLMVQDMTTGEKMKAQDAIVLLTEKRDGTIKARSVYNGKETRDWISREDSASPTVSQESIVITAVIDTKEGRDVMTVDVPNAFIQTLLPEKYRRKGERVIMKFTGRIVDILIKMNPGRYEGFVVYENGKKVIYVEIIRAIYGMIIASMLWYQKFRKDLEEHGFKFNPYDPCVANKMVNGKQQTVRFHVDDLMSSHEDKRVNDKFLKWLQEKYGEHGAVKGTRGREHDYLGQIMRFKKQALEIDQTKYVEKMIDEFPIKLKKSDTVTTPANEQMFKQDDGNKLEPKKAEMFHRMVAKALYIAKRGRPDIQPIVAVLTTRVKSPTNGDWEKLLRLMKYLNGTRKKTLTIHTKDGINVIKWYVDASFAVHPDFRSHTGASMFFGENTGAIQNLSRKQKLNAKSSTIAELIGVDDVSTLVLWTSMFLKEQGYHVDRNIIYQDNKSAILLETNGRASAGKQSRAINVRYFFITDQVEKGNLEIQYCSTDRMRGDFQTKALQGTKFREFRKDIMGN